MFDPLIFIGELTSKEVTVSDAGHDFYKTW